MISIALLSTRSPSALALSLEKRGVIVFEALSVSEIMYLCEHEPVQMVTIAPDVDESKTAEVQLRFPTIALAQGATADEIVWELTNLLEKGSQAIH